MRISRRSHSPSGITITLSILVHNDFEWGIRFGTSIMRGPGLSTHVAGPEERAHIVDAICARGGEMMMHLIQQMSRSALFEATTGPEERRKIVACMGGRMVDLATNCYGYYVLQKALDCKEEHASHLWIRGNCIPQDSEVRIDMLRERAGVKCRSTAASKSKRRKEDDDLMELAAAAGGLMQPAVLPTTDGHINFFEDLEHNAIVTAIRTAKKTEPVETERGVPLAPSWYTEARTVNPDNEEEVVDEKRKRDMARKSVHDPLTSITYQLAARHASTSSSFFSTAYKPKPSYRRPPNANANANAPPEREMRGSETPSSVHGGGYGDVFNRREVEEAHRGRERRDPRRARW
ncbi:hypothetical protein K438DRAFT_1985047 [Mycena galopus ATCC 62051]|nr:hypothetical protein K438DRAFT_1985047 [Mycena galopus ATCC 62051]